MNKKKFLILIIISLVLQGFLFQLLEWKAEDMLNPLFRYGKAYTINVDLSHSQNHSLSYNNRFLSYISENNLKVIDLTTNNTVFTSPYKKNMLLNYKWLPDRNSLVYLVRNQNNYQEILLYSLDLDTISSKSEAKDINPRLDRAITMSTSRILNIDLSTYTNNLYILLDNSQQSSELIKIDIMKNINRLDLPGESIHAFSVSNKYGIIFIQSTGPSSQGIFSIEGMNRSTISIDPSEVLLGCHDELLFTGKLDINTLKVIYAYSIKEKKKTMIWQGNIQYNKTDNIVAAKNALILKGLLNLEIIRIDGSNESKKIDSKLIIMSPTGKMYLEIIADPNEAVYYWHAI